ncbi:toll-Interleukin receptor [Pseudomonas sp. MG-9]|uniref:toll-Interleukin receptor n=1 Tax=Pseudomonas sp. MG-9 TaxID=2839032 RepID=UPI001BFFE889|nr:toll-Interleukin receptor [Pseudomonas sp. MG-9]MBT9263551.1 toll-Interleukin receptor [Pseudomonas sp. MG-9]
MLQASQPWISTQHIDKGAIWFSEISDQLRDTAAGIVCLTQENKNKPWILFETGALAKGLSANRVCTFLVDLTSTDIEDPLAQFNHTTPDRASVWGLVNTLNNCLENGRLDERILKQVFDTYWPKFEVDFAAALEATPHEAPVAPRSEDSILAEILANTRALSGRVRELEHRVTSSPDPSLAISGSYAKRTILGSGIVGGLLGTAASAHGAATELDRAAQLLGLSPQEVMDAIGNRQSRKRKGDVDGKEPE